MTLNSLLVFNVQKHLHTPNGYFKHKHLNFSCLSSLETKLTSEDKNQANSSEVY